MPGSFKTAYLGLLFALLAGCKIVVTVPEGGRVVTEDGFTCRAGQTCVIDVSDDSFDSTFTARSERGYTFTRWARKPAALCGNRTGSCYLSTLAFSGFPALMELLASDQEFHLEPVFVSYDLDYWQQVLMEIDQGAFATDRYLYSARPDADGCDPGALKGAPQERALEALNQTRALHALSAVQYDSFYAMQMQETSLVQRANNYLSHFPSPGDNCYTVSAADGARSSNLGSSSQASDPAADIFGWTNDSNNLSALMEAGHRRWMLYPQLGYASYGQVEGFTALKVFDFGNPPSAAVSPDLEFVALPYRYYPYVLVSQGAKPTPWSLSMVPADGQSGSFQYFTSAKIEVIETETGDSLIIRDQHTDDKGFGLANFLSWLVDGWDYDTHYTVRINNIRMPDGGVRDLEYPVVVDRYHLFNVDHPLEDTDGMSGNTLKGTLNPAGDKDSYSTPHYSGSYRVAGSSQFSNMAFFIHIYDQDKRLIKSSDEPFTVDLPPGADTVIISNCDENGLCYQGEKNYSVTFTARK